MSLRGGYKTAKNATMCGKGNGMAWLGQGNGSAAIDAPLVDANAEGDEVLGGWEEPWPWHGGWKCCYGVATAEQCDLGGFVP